MNAKVLEIAKEMLLEAGGDIGQEFQAATNTQLRDWGERLAAAAKGEEPRAAGNVTKMREVLKKCHKFLGMLIREDVLPGKLPPEASDLADDVWDALADPRENFTRFKTPEEANAASKECVYVIQQKWPHEKDDKWRVKEGEVFATLPAATTRKRELESWHAKKARVGNSDVAFVFRVALKKIPVVKEEA